MGGRVMSKCLFFSRSAGVEERKLLTLMKKARGALGYVNKNYNMDHGHSRSLQAAGQRDSRFLI